MTRSGRAFKCIFSFFFVYFIAAAALVYDGLHDQVHSADVAVVLGNSVTATGLPAERLRARLDRAAELYRQGLFKNIIVSGGVGREGIDEAVVMKQYLVEQQIPEPSIITDSAGNNTWLTALFTTNLMRERGWTSVIAISQYFHLTRAKLALQKLGAKEVYTAGANFYELRDLYSICREVTAYVWYMVR